MKRAIRAIGILGFVFVIGAASAIAAPADNDTAIWNEVKALQVQNAALQASVKTLQGQVTALQSNGALALGPYVSVNPNPINGVSGPNIIFKGANVNIEDGSGTTDDNTTTLLGGNGKGTLTGLGNLIIGYDENGFSLTRGGSHNLVVGADHGFSSLGGLVAGWVNQISAQFSSVSGGTGNIASDLAASVSGGSGNTASGVSSSVGGGFGNNASSTNQFLP